MIKYYEKSTKIRRSTSDGISLGQGKVWLRLNLADNQEKVILDLKNVFFFPYSPLNLVSLGSLSNYGIYYNNKNKVLYDKESKAILVYTQQWKSSFLL